VVSSETDPLIRPADLSDADAIAALHADSWRRNYRGAYADEYLDGDVGADRLAVWTDRLAHPSADARTLVAQELGGLIGFVHVVLGHDPQWGALVDNLHVAHRVKRSGVGTRLLAGAAAAVVAQAPRRGLYLWVLEQNVAAQAFYLARGGVCVSREQRGPFPGGGTAVGLRMFWADPGDLIH
jgi:ribosomal protein S18 acetylase RimI-like enzyme